MAKHILDQPRGRADAPILRYARAARAQSPEIDRNAVRYAEFRRRAKGPYDPAHRLRAYLRIERGFEA